MNLNDIVWPEIIMVIFCNGSSYQINPRVKVKDSKKFEWDFEFTGTDDEEHKIFVRIVFDENDIAHLQYRIFQKRTWYTVKFGIRYDLGFTTLLFREPDDHEGDFTKWGPEYIALLGED